MSAVTPAAVVLLVAALVSWLAVRYLNWAMAPRRFGLRVVLGGILPLAMLVGALLAVQVAQEGYLLAAITKLADLPSSGKRLMAAMLLTGLMVAWFTARQRDWHEAKRIIADREVFD